jgi:hypothetical protein
MAIVRERVEQSQEATSPHEQRSQQSSASQSSSAVYVFDPMGEVRVARLRLARRWRDEGAIYQALCAYADMLTRYRQTPTADAAAEELLEMATMLARQGMFHTALGIFCTIDEAS